jgi:tetratricopeptide (TPR) repeat protein
MFREGRTMMKVARFVDLCLLLVLCLAPTIQAADGKAKKETDVEPTHWGRVIGHVYDAESGAPLVGADVQVLQRVEPRNAARTTSRTDTSGRYQCEAVIGRISSHIDIGRIIESSLIGMILGGATEKTKRVDISRLNMRVRAEGYEPFEGVVPCKSVDAKEFAVRMEPILLVRSGSGEVSTVAEGWGVVKMASLSVQPVAAMPGTNVTITAQITAPPLPRPGDLNVVCSYILSGKYRMIDLKPSSPQTDGSLVCVGTVGVPKSAKPEVAEVKAKILSCPYDVFAGADTGSALLQVVTTEEGKKAAETRAEAYRCLQAGNNVEAAAKLKELCESPNVTPWDLERYADVCQVLHDNAGAIEALRRLVEISPENERMLNISKYAAALVSGGEGARAISECAPAVTAVKEKERPKRVPLPLMVAIGKAYLQVGKLDDARRVADEILKWQEAGWYPGTAEFRNDLRIAEAEDALRRDPGSAKAHADYGRVLLDMGRWEEAATELGLALRADPSIPALRRDLAYALLQLKGGEQRGKVDLDAAIADAEAQAEMVDAKGKVTQSKDFHAWHSLGLLLYCKGCQQADASNPEASATLKRSQKAFKEALRCGRSAAQVSRGEYSPVYGYLSKAVVAISGFAYPEANSDFVILESLRALEEDSNDYLAHFGLATALIDLGQPDLAARSLKRVLELKPGFAEAEYVSALIALQKADYDTALTHLRAVLKVNPRHPHANLTLARIYTEKGDMASAAACLAAHARLYGTRRER